MITNDPNPPSHLHQTTSSSKTAANFTTPNTAPPPARIHCYGSRLEHPVDTSILTSLNIRFLSVDRPGHGLSSPSPHRTLLSFADDIDQLTDRLGMECRWIFRPGHCAGFAA
mmetsp:Transcript_15976/g.33501  ORF Transcript_15976/g.33501 Transcript_15976/m.33501 type:complete len:112 (-) Transcript_15976:128-463(-)